MRQPHGFTLIELMITVAIVAILAAIALPSYTQYVTRGKLQEAVAMLADMRTKMEQHYMDNRRYSTTTGGGTCGIGLDPVATLKLQVKYFTFKCESGTVKAAGDQEYVITATGVDTQGMSGFILTINHANVKKTTGVGSGWTLPATDCWVQKKNGSC